MRMSPFAVFSSQVELQTPDTAPSIPQTGTKQQDPARGPTWSCRELFVANTARAVRGWWLWYHLLPLPPGFGQGGTPRSREGRAGPCLGTAQMPAQPRDPPVPSMCSSCHFLCSFGLTRHFLPLSPPWVLFIPLFPHLTRACQPPHTNPPVPFPIPCPFQIHQFANTPTPAVQPSPP